MNNILYIIKFQFIYIFHYIFLFQFSLSYFKKLFLSCFLFSSKKQIQDGKREKTISRPNCRKSLIKRFLLS